MTSFLVQKLWNYCNILRDDGMSYSDYVEQLTYLLFLKMADENADQGKTLGQYIPKGLEWKGLIEKDSNEILSYYSGLLTQLGKQDGTLGLIFAKSQNKFSDPAKFRRLLVDLIDKERWTALSGDVKGDAYEGLLEKNAQDTKSGAGQYFTPRALVRSIVKAIDPKIGETVCDPACGTGGFLLAANDHISASSGGATKYADRVRRNDTFTGYELVPGTARLAAMNMLLHGVGGDTVPIIVGDALSNLPRQKYDIVLSNPPFGKKGSTTIFSESRRGTRDVDLINRSDFWASTSNKQLNFLQHIYSILEGGGRAAVVVPDNVLFEGGAGEVVRRKLLADCEVHTLLRLPAGLFYAQGIKANVLFFTKKQPQEQRLWIYDLRASKKFSLKSNPLAESDLYDFVECFRLRDRQSSSSLWSEENPHGRWRPYSYSELYAREQFNWDISWIKTPDHQTEYSGMSSADLLEGMSSDLEDILVDIRALSVLFPKSAF